MKEWNFENGICVVESEFDGDLHIFVVYNGDEYLGTIYPACIEDMKDCIKKLNSGKDPITEGWEDGYGHTCTLDGWGKIFKIDWNNGKVEEFEWTLEEVMEKAVEKAEYTGESITIEEFDGYESEVVATLPWYGVAADEDDIVTVDFGDLGFYGEWILD